MALTRKDFDSWCRRGIRSLILVMLVFAPLAFGAVDEWAFLVLEGLGAVLFIVWGVRLWVNPHPKLFWPPLAWAVLAFALYATVRYFTADIEYVARAEVLRVLLLAVIFLVVVSDLHGPDEAQIISFTLIALATVIAAYAVFQLVTHSSRVWNEVSPYQGRASGTFISPNNLAGFLEMILPLALTYLLVGRISVISRILLGYAVVVLCLGLAVTFSRGGWIAAASGFFLVLGVLVGHRNHRWKAILLLVMMIGGGVFFVSKYLSQTTAYQERVARTTPHGPRILDLDARLQIWQAAERMWQDYFWLGVGPGHFDYRFPEYRPEEIQLRAGHVHNDYLELVTDWGLVGGLIVLGGVAIFMVGLVQTWPHARRAEQDFGRGYSNRFAFFLGAAGGLFALAVHSAMDFNLHIPANALVGVILLALLAGMMRFATGRYWFRIGRPVKLMVTGSLLTLTVLLAWDEWRRGGETLWLERAARQELFSTGRAQQLQKAFAREPDDFQTADNIGECYRQQSFLGGEDFAVLAQKAMDWYARAMKLNPHDASSRLNTGMCLDWLEKHEEAVKFYQEAEARDPNSYYTVAYIGWHYLQVGDYAAARHYFDRSWMFSHDGGFVRTYLDICETKQVQKASGKPPLWPGY